MVASKYRLQTQRGGRIRTILNEGRTRRTTRSFSCRSARVQPRPEPLRGKLTALQSDQFKLHADVEDIHWWFLARRRILHELAHKLAPPSKSTLAIDVGCGTGGNIASFAKDYTCIGIDTSVEGIELAKRRYPEVHFICGSAPADLGDAVEQARLFFLTDVLEHIDDDVGFLTELLMALKPGACILLTVPADMSLWSEQDVTYGHYRRYDVQSLQHLWFGLPVTVRMLSYFNARLYPIVKVIRILNRLRKRPFGDAGTDLKMPMHPVNRLLHAVFAGERRVLVNLLTESGRRGYTFGVSLIAALVRKE